MEKDNSQPEPKPAGNRPPPRPPHGTVIGVGPDSDNDSEKRRAKEVVRINLPPKPSAAITINLASSTKSLASAPQHMDLRFVVAVKAFVVIGPLILVALIRGASLGGDVAVHLLAGGYAVSFLILVFVGINQSSAGLRKSAVSSFIFAVIAVLWILVLLLLLPSLASA
jgi:hypothetical protein